MPHNHRLKLMRGLSTSLEYHAQVQSLFGGTPHDEALAALERTQASMALVRELFRDGEAMEFMIATIPTVLAVNESRRLLAALTEDAIPVKRIIVRFLLPRLSPHPIPHRRHVVFVIHFNSRAGD